MGRPEPSQAVRAAIDRLGPVDLAVALLTYNNAETLPGVLDAVTAGGASHCSSARTALIAAHARSSDTTRDRVSGTSIPSVVVPHEAPAGERVAVPFHGVPGRGPALRASFDVAQRLGAKALVLLEADATTITPEWIERLAAPVLDGKADFVAPAYTRHRWEG